MTHLRTGESPIVELASSRKVVYYPEFGYLDPYYWEGSLKTEGWVNAQVEERHLANLRLLALYFHNIHVPISHLLSPVGTSVNVVIKRVLSHHGVKELINQDILMTTLWEHVSGVKEQIERYKVFLSNIHWGYETLKHEDSLDSIKRMNSYNRDVTSQSLFTGNQIVKRLKKGNYLDP